MKKVVATRRNIPMRGEKQFRFGISRHGRFNVDESQIGFVLQWAKIYGRVEWTLTHGVLTTKLKIGP